MPIEPEQVPQLTAVLITPCGNDHYSVLPCKALATFCTELHGLAAMNRVLSVGITPARKHSWRMASNDSPKGSSCTKKNIQDSRNTAGSYY